MTPTQVRILEILAGASNWMTPLEIATLWGEHATAGGVARSLRVLLAAGKVQQRQIGWWDQMRGVALYAYASPERSGSFPQEVREFQRRLL